MSMSEPPHLPGVEHTYVEVPGVRVHVATAGPADGPPVVLLHGWPQHWWCWRGVIGPLAAAGHRVYAPDLRGSGWSSVPSRGYDKEQLATDLLALLDALGVDGPVGLAGHDWGGWTAQLTALREPARVRKLAVLNIPPVWGDPRSSLPHAWRFTYAFVNATPFVGPFLQRTPLMERALMGVPPADRPVFAERFKDPGRARAGSLLYRTLILREVAAIAAGRYDGQRLTMPTLALYGDADPVVRPSMIERLAEHGDDVTLEPVPGVGHFVIDERPELVAARLVDWFA